MLESNPANMEFIGATLPRVALNIPYESRFETKLNSFPHNNVGLFLVMKPFSGDLRIFPPL